MKGLWHIAAGAFALTVPWGWGASALAQNAPLAYGNPDAGADDGGASAPSPTDAPDAASGSTDNGGKPRKRTRIVPYLELDQTVYSEAVPQNSVATYTTVAAGVDMLVNSHSTTGMATIRYEHQFLESHGQGSADTLTGIARTSTQIIPRMLTFDFGGLATRTAISATGGTLLNPANNFGSIYQTYSIFGGPSLSTHAGVLAIKGSYDVGYNRIDQSQTYSGLRGTEPVDLFGHSLTQQGTASVGTRPGEVLPFGIALTGGYLREDMSTLDQRLIDDRVGVRVTQPVSRSLAVVGDVGWEKLTVAQRNAEVDAQGNPVLSSSGQYVTDTSGPRKLAYRTDGLSWDIGVVWRPSKRTMASASIGRRYDSTTYYGSLYYAPSSHETILVSVNDGIYAYGSQVMSALQQVPTDFTVTRDPFSGNVGSCFLGSTGGSCLTGALGSADALVFRMHGVNAAYALTMGRLTFSAGAGYVSRRFITAPGTILSYENGALDQTWYVSAGISGPIDRQTRFVISSFASLYRTDQVLYGDTGDWGVNAQLIHHLTDRLVGTAAVEVLGVSQQLSPDQLDVLGQLGLRYNFR